MPNFKYKAVGRDGKKILGEYEAQNKGQVIAMLRENKYYPTRVEEVIERKEINLDLFTKIKNKDIAIFCRQLYTMLNAGVSLISCLDILRVQTEKKKFRDIISHVHEDLQKGSTFSEGLNKQKKVFPELLINMVEAGEVSGNLDVIMERMAVHYEKEEKLDNKVKGAMVYPLVLSVVAVLVIIFLLVVVMPTFVGLFEGSGVPLPLPTRILLATSYGIEKYWYIIFPTIGGILLLFKKYLDSDRGRKNFDKIKFKIPIIRKTTVNVVTSRFTRTLSTLLASGIPLIQSIDVVGKIVGNRVVSDGLVKTTEDLRKGISLSNLISNIGVFPTMMVSMIKIGEESGSLEEILDKTADYYDEEVETSLKKLTTMLEPLMIVVMAVIIGFIVISMVLPMFEMINTVGV